MRISDWSSDVCSSDLPQQREEAGQRIAAGMLFGFGGQHQQVDVRMREQLAAAVPADGEQGQPRVAGNAARPGVADQGVDGARTVCDKAVDRSEEHTSELQSLMRISYAVLCLNKKKTTQKKRH